MNVTLRYFEGCPHWETAHDRLREALRAEGMADVEPVLERVETIEDAERLRFVGSPTILVRGRDPFAGAEVAFGLTCRVYQTPEGLAGSPTPEQLRTAPPCSLELAHVAMMHQRMFRDPYRSPPCCAEVFSVRGLVTVPPVAPMA